MAVSLSAGCEDCDVFVVGAGLAGLAAAIGFARAASRWFPAARPNGSATAARWTLLGRSIDLLQGLDVWRDIEPLAAPLRSLRIIDDTGALFPPRPIEIHADEISLDAFGWNIENAALADALAKAAAAPANLRRIESKVANFDFAPERARLRLADGRRSAARLVVGADGRGSPARQAAGIDVRTHLYPQSALTVFLSHSRPHEDYSTEFHTRQGPFTLVPLPASAERPPALQPRLGDVARRGGATRRARRRRARRRDRSVKRARCSGRCGSRARVASSRWCARS